MGGGELPDSKMMRAAGYVAEFICPPTLLKSVFGGYACVDDTDLVVAKLSFNSAADAAQALQLAMTMWEKGLKSTSGAIVPEKTYVYLIDFEWRAGRWDYLSCAKSPASFTAKILTGSSGQSNDTKFGGRRKH